MRMGGWLYLSFRVTALAAWASFPVVPSPVPAIGVWLNNRSRCTAMAMSRMRASRLSFPGIAGRLHDLLIDDAQAPGQRSRAQHHGDGVVLFEREVARDDPRAAHARLPDHGRRE